MTFAYDVGWWGSAMGHPAFQQYYGANFNAATGRNVLAPSSSLAERKLIQV